jgi:hypothetical protein
MAEVLTDYLREVAKRPFVWGRQDCAVFVLEWFDRLSQKPRAHLWQDAYDDEASCKAWTDAQGGYEAIADAFLPGWYGARRAEPKPGNAVLAGFRGRQAMGIRVDARQVAMLAPGGLLLTHRATVLGEWGL